MCVNAIDVFNSPVGRSLILTQHSLSSNNASTHLSVLLLLEFDPESPTWPVDFVFFDLPPLSLSLSLSLSISVPAPDCLRDFLSSFFTTPTPVPVAASIPEKTFSDLGFSFSSRQLLG